MNRFWIIGASLVVMLGCSVSRRDKLESKSERVEKALLIEQQKAVSLSDQAGRRAKLDHLTQLRGLLSAANISLGVIPYAMEEAERDIAYDVLDEAYDTIQWNIPLGPGESMRPLPKGFEGGVLNVK